MFPPLFIPDFYPIEGSHDHHLPAQTCLLPMLGRDKDTPLPIDRALTCRGVEKAQERPDVFFEVTLGLDLFFKAGPDVERVRGDAGVKVGQDEDILSPIL